MLDDSQTAEFVHLLTEHQTDIYLYICALVFGKDDAADIWGETNTVLWAQRDTFLMGTNFRAWAFRVARHKVLEWHRQCRREKTLFSGEMIQELADFAERQAEAPSQRLKDLNHCLEKIPPADRELIMGRYEPGASTEQIAAQVERPKEWVYKAVCRIRRVLTLCVARQIAARHQEECR